MPEREASPESKQRTALLLADLWSRNKPVIEGRLDVLERAAVGPLSDEMRLEAHGVAHKLAGSLGMFGFAEGTNLARELELLLESPSPQAAEIARMARELRSIIFPAS